mmetsp:Transcript_19017/g.52841  ORF Transcript_19017/g.52841 Transcript_19017/m.52841 type:complete len:93 (-) Transcript_19017:27-305(-)
MMLSACTIINERDRLHEDLEASHGTRLMELSLDLPALLHSLSLSLEPILNDQMIAPGRLRSKEEEQRRRSPTNARPKQKSSVKAHRFVFVLG